MEKTKRKRLPRGLRKHLRIILRGLPKEERLRIRQSYLNRLKK